MSKRLLAALIAASGAVLAFALVLGFATPAATSFGVPTFLVGVVSSALVGAALGTVPHAIAAKKVRGHSDSRNDAPAARGNGQD
ncbi:hypothetical protein [Nocardia sp. BMG51109]|uniref:hypothetical protein n=1 Tax=Nocardia sp. BMG51109 TaxID=1056816 RepID=UPI0004654047|nr:hypothetical protein [Nocardia sp. BMG51109]